uniref:Uncharacterized protein n=1 Tax=Ananas comosus var. bracteatus TaxID=296719 RepID=A0A6V7Q5I8_ANACO|nr:unnamed protein product [Ananas comosus var. bracteatus]
MRAVYRYSLDGCTGTESVPVHLDGCTGTDVVNGQPEARVCCLAGFVPKPRARDWSFVEGGSSTLAYLEPCFRALVRHDDLRLEMDFYACLPLCSFAHACEGRSPQAGTPEIAIATHARPCGIGRRNGMPWGRLISRVGMLTTMGPLGTAQAGLHMGRSYEIWNKWNQFVNEQFDNLANLKAWMRELGCIILTSVLISFFSPLKKLDRKYSGVKYELELHMLIQHPEPRALCHGLSCLTHKLEAIRSTGSNVGPMVYLSIWIQRGFFHRSSLGSESALIPDYNARTHRNHPRMRML